MEDIKPFLLPVTATLRETMQNLEDTRIKIAFIADEQGRILGACSDGDIRRALLQGKSLESPVKDVMNTSPILGDASESRENLQSMMRRKRLYQLPLVDEQQIAQKILLINDPRRRALDDVPVILMAGGEGQRLRPLTEDCPKPLLPIGDKPLLERIISRFRDQGFKNFYISINYLGHMIEDHFGDGKRFDVNISYLKEDKKLGTGGALGLLPEHISGPMLIMNGDLITELDFRALVDHHRSSASQATMCVREYMTAIPFGVVEFDADSYRQIVEKPTLKHHINSGIYCLSDSALSFVPKNTYYDMPTLFDDIKNVGGSCGVYKSTSLWYDIGNRAEYDRAQRLFGSVASESAGE